jgi:hypothetical protein
MSETSPPPTRRFQAIPIEETVKKVRRFAPEPVETTTRSSRKEDTQISNDSTIERKDFAGKRRFLPTPVETTFKSRKKAAHPYLRLNLPQTRFPKVLLPQRRQNPEEGLLLN